MALSRTEKRARSASGSDVAVHSDSEEAPSSWRALLVESTTGDYGLKAGNAAHSI
jgi:hypothetical protein